MNLTQKLALATLLTNCFILVGVGHGVLPIGLLEIMIPYGLITGSSFVSKIWFSLYASYNDTLLTAAILSLLGQVLLVSNLFSRSKRRTIAAIIILWLGFFYLIHTLFTDDGLSSFSFCFGLPFLVLSIILFIRIVKSDMVINDIALQDNSQ